MKTFYLNLTTDDGELLDRYQVTIDPSEQHPEAYALSKKIARETLMECIRMEIKKHAIDDASDYGAYALYWYAQADNLHALLDWLDLSQGGTWDTAPAVYPDGTSHPYAKASNGKLSLWIGQCPGCKQVHAFAPLSEHFDVAAVIAKPIGFTTYPPVYCGSCEPQFCSVS